MTDLRRAGAEAPVVVLVTDGAVALARTLEIVRAAATALGPRLLVQLRDKENGPVAIRDAARALREVTRELGAWFVVNGATTIAQDVGADGVHLPSDRSGTVSARIATARRLLGDDAFVTAAAHDDEEVTAATLGGASGLLVSAIYPTPGKGTPRGLNALISARAVVEAAGPAHRPRLYALGGIDVDNASSCAPAGADGVAVIRAFYGVELGAVAATARALAAPFTPPSR